MYLFITRNLNNLLFSTAHYVLKLPSQFYAVNTQLAVESKANQLSFHSKCIAWSTQQQQQQDSIF